MVYWLPGIHRPRKISCIYATARPSDAMIGRKDECHIKLFLDSLSKQTMAPDEFEVMIADCYYDKRPEQDHIKDNTYRGVKYPFTIYHWQVKSPWLKRGLWTGQAPWTQGIMLSNAELVCTFGDCCEPIPEYLERMWSWHQKGYFAMGLVVFKKNNKLLLNTGSTLDSSSSIIERTKELIEKDWAGHPVIRDMRWYYVDRHQGHDGVNIPTGSHAGDLFNGYASVSMKALLIINGFDENYDGDKCAGDLATGQQLMKARSKIVLDKSIWIFENAHENVPKSILTYDGPAIRSNLGLLMLNHEKNRFKSNSYILTDEEIDWIYNYSKKDFGDYDQRQNPHFKWWREHPPMFDIVEVRKQVQESLNKGIVEIPEYYPGT